MDVAMEVSRLVLQESEAAQLICLKEIAGSRLVAIPIGIFEAVYIRRRVQAMPFPRPLPHDLLAKVVQGLGGELQSVRIGECRHQTWYATLRLERAGQTIDVDCRPSDAIALALAHDPPAPIYVAEKLLAQAAAT